MRRYERVTFRPEGERARSIYLEGPRLGKLAGSEVLCGREVNREGESIIREGDRERIISIELVEARTPLVMDLVYGELVEG